MNYKIKGAIRRNKKGFIVFIIIWIVMAIFLIPALTYSYAVLTRVPGNNSLQIALQEFGGTITNPINAFECVIKREIIPEYLGTLLGATLIYSIFFFIGFVKSAPKNEYTDIEHGSSDWSKKGEQYKILNKNKGILLARDNYLPVDKRGNVNVLVVGRFWFW